MARVSGVPDEVYTALARIRDTTLRRFDSLFDGEARRIWTLENLERFHVLFVERFDAGEGVFLSKYRKQLEGADSDVLQLAAELLYVQQFFTSLTGWEKKLENVREVLSWCGRSVQVPSWAVDGIKRGLAGDQSFNQHRAFHLAWLNEFLIKWHRVDGSVRQGMLEDPWRFREFVMTVESEHGAHQPMREAWLFMIFPDTFESISSRKDKKLIRDTFAKRLLGGSSANIDADLLEIRKLLGAEAGEGFHYYRPPLADQWQPPKASKRDVVEQLKLHELQDAADYYSLEARDRRVRDDLIDAVVRSKRARLHEILGGLSRDRLKEICVALELDDTGREKAVLIERLAGDHSGASDDPPEDEDTDDGEQDAMEVLLRLLGQSLIVQNAGEAWPTTARIQLGELNLGANIYARIVGGSSRDNALERRFQNPGKGHPITHAPDRYALLFGLWLEQGEDRAVIVALDAYRRIDRQTRFSMFMPLSLLEQAADTGFATHVNNKGETLYAFRPENLARYVRALIDDGTWRPPELVEPPATAGIAIPRTKTRPDEPTSTDNLYIRPRVGMYSAFARLNYKPWFALAEFVDNSIQSFLQNRDSLIAAGHDGPLVIGVNLDDNELSIYDVAGGIAWKDFPRAFSPAAPPDDASGLSEFGLGMKAAACWFAKRWSVRTSALGEAIERTVVFDIPKIARDGVENIPIESRPAKESDHYTVVTMTDLRVRPRGKTLTKIKEHLSSIYRVLMNEGIVKIRLTMGGRMEELAYTPPALLVAAYYRHPEWEPVQWNRKFLVDLGDRKVTGWAGIMNEGSYAHAGFSVFRRRRLIEGSVGETYKPHPIFGSPNSYASQRVVGELFVDGFDVTHTKDGIQWNGYEDEVLAEIRSQIDTPGMPILDQAQGYRARKTADVLPKNFGIEALVETANMLKQPVVLETLQQELHDASDTTDAPPTPTPPESVFQQRELRLQIVRDAKPWTVHLELVRDPGAPFYSTSWSDRDGQQVVGVQINLDHDFSIAYINDNEDALQPLLRFIAALALGEKIARDGGAKNTGAVRQNANQLLRVIAGDAPTF